MVCRKSQVDDKQGVNKWVLCDACDSWCHANGGDLDDKEYEVIKKGTKRLHWFCKECYIPIPELLKLIKEIKARCDCLEKELRETRNEAQLSSKKVEDGLP